MQDKEIAARLDCHAGVVSKWRRRVLEERVDGLRDKPRAGRPRRFPPGAGRRSQGDRLRALPVTHGLPLSRYTRAELHRLVVKRGVTDASATTIWRWLHDDALKPWQQRS
jgi:transposase